MLKPELAAGLRVLVVEDESIVTMLIEDTLLDLGCEIAGIASRFDEALEKARSLDIDAAILDVNLNGDKTFPIAELLAGRGIPFVFATGYGAAGLPEKFRDAPILAKPFQNADLRRALAQSIAQAA